MANPNEEGLHRQASEEVVDLLEQVGKTAYSDPVAKDNQDGGALEEGHSKMSRVVEAGADSGDTKPNTVGDTSHVVEEDNAFAGEEEDAWDVGSLTAVEEGVHSLGAYPRSPEGEVVVKEPQPQNELMEEHMAPDEPFPKAPHHPLLQALPSLSELLQTGYPSPHCLLGGDDEGLMQSAQSS